MNVLVIRHAIAEDRRRFAKASQDDGLRPLTARGRRRMREAVTGLRHVVPQFHVLANSPLTRAVQTADLIAHGFRGAKRIELPQLAPDQPVKSVLKWLQDQRFDATIALVGHEPQLGVFVSWMLTGLEESFVDLKKGAACMLVLNEHVRAGRATLLWSLKPSHLRRLGGV